MSASTVSFSQCGEDIIVNFLMRTMLHVDEIRYLDIGSNDPEEFNNTYFFYKQGFRGVSVDANPFFTKAYKDKRPEDKFLCAGVGPTKTKSNFYVIDPHTLSTFSEKEAISYTKSGIHTLVKTEKRKIETIEGIIKKHFKKSAPNLLSIDVEGYDLEILKSINFEKWRPLVICAETINYTTDASQHKLPEIINFIKSQGYTVYADTYINTIFVDSEAWKNRK